MVPKATALLLAALALVLPLHAADPVPTKPLVFRLDTGVLNVPPGSLSLGDPAFGGTLPTARLNVGTGAGSLAAGNDARLALAASALQPGGSGAGLTGITPAQAGADPAGAATAAVANKAAKLAVAATQTASGALVPDTLVPFNCTGANLVATMPASPTAGTRVSLKKVDATANTLTVTAPFDGATAASTLTLRLQNQGKTFVYDGTSWWAVYGDLNLPTLDARYGAATLFDAVLSYGASGIKAQTTGTVAAGSTTLTAADASTYKAGQGIFVLGAGASGANLVTMVTAVAGNVITLQTAATAAVGNARVQHDDTAAVNAARQAAYNAGGGVAFLRRTGCDGYYRCNGPLLAATNSILGVPAPLVYGVGPAPVVELRGEVAGSMVAGAAGQPNVLTGVVIDAMDCPAGTGALPCLLADAPYVATTSANWQTVFGQIDSRVDRITFAVRANSGVSGLGFGNSVRAEVGDAVNVFMLGPQYAVVQPTVDSQVGVMTPQTFNNIRSRVGLCQISGWKYGLYAAELCVLNRPTLALNFCGLRLYGSVDYQGGVNSGAHEITGSVCIQDCARLVEAINPVTVDLNVSAEIPANGNWYSLELFGNNAATPSGWRDPGNVARGKVSYQCFDFRSGGASPLPITGGGNVLFTNLRTASTGLQQLAGSMSLTGTMQVTNSVVGAAGTGVSRLRHGVATLSGGTATVSDANVTASTRILLSAQDNNTLGTPRVSARAAGTSFTITAGPGDSGVVAYELIEP